MPLKRGLKNAIIVLIKIKVRMFVSGKIINLKFKNQNIQVHKFKSVASTNVIAAEMALNGVTEGTTVIAESQTAGKGRLGRTFLSQKGGIYLSIVLRPTLPPADVLFITVAAAVAAARAIENISGKKCDIKWVNDIYLNNKKICGILTEGAFNTDGSLKHAVLGVGINLFEPKNKFPKELPLADSVFHRKDSVLFKKRLKKRAIRDFIETFFEFYGSIHKKEFMPEYIERSLLTGKEITFTKNEKTLRAVVEGIDNNANLVVNVDGETQKLSHGEIQIIGVEQLLV